MAYGKVQETFWRDPTIRAMQDEERYFMLYLLTCPHRNRLGMFVLDSYYAAADLQWDPDRVDGAIKSLVSRGRILYDKQTGILFVIRYLKHNTMENAKVAKGAVSELGRLPDNPYFEALLESLTKWQRPHYAVVLEALSNRIANDLPNEQPNQQAEEQLYRIPHHSHSHNRNQAVPTTTTKTKTSRAREAIDDLDGDAKKLEALDIAPAAISAVRQLSFWTPDIEWGIVAKWGPNGTDERIWNGTEPEDRPAILGNALLSFMSASPQGFYPPFLRKIILRLIDEEQRTGAEQITAREEADIEAQRRANVQRRQREDERQEDRSASEVREKLAWLAQQPDSVKENVELEVLKRATAMNLRGNVPDTIRRGIVLSVLKDQASLQEV